GPAHGDAGPSRHPAPSVAWQARRAHRAPRPPARRDTAPAAYLPRCALVMSAVVRIMMSEREIEVRKLLARVPDPEMSVLSIVDRGIVSEVRGEADGRMRVAITPTYTGCPATEVIRTLVRAALDAGGHADAILEEVLSPPWSSDWLTPAGREK